ncbi:hypothetical protein BD310DRAFT_686718 [Dichomitus squalens]|uniref:Secreted protein n=1 Tax=Dichomitus squalens TaxID=114155 RepID=A0A4Q9PME4_9APHY|nr:hypothetical protein BD310DRAFT_686718 [Dichomitus squalens]
MRRSRGLLSSRLALLSWYCSAATTHSLQISHLHRPTWCASPLYDCHSTTSGSCHVALSRLLNSDAGRTHQ